MLLYVAGGAEGVRLCVASLCCKEERADFCLFGPELSTDHRSAARRFSRPGKPKHAARVTSACLTGTLLHRDRLWPTDDMVFFHRGIFSAQQSSCRVIIYLNVTDVFVYQMLRKT